MPEDSQRLQGFRSCEVAQSYDWRFSKVAGLRRLRGALGYIIHTSYRSPKSLVTNLVMNLVTNLVITKLGEEFGDIFVTLFGDSPNWVMILMSFSSPHLVGHEIG